MQVLSAGGIAYLEEGNVLKLQNMAIYNVSSN